MTAYFLDDNDVAILKRLVAEVRSFRVDSRARVEDYAESGPDVHVARTPPGGVPRRVGDNPGAAQCFVYQLVDFGLVAAAADVVLVSNLSAQAIAGDDWVLVERDKYGDWYCTSMGLSGSSTGGGGSGTTPPMSGARVHRRRDQNVGALRTDEFSGLPIVFFGDGFGGTTCQCHQYGDELDNRIVWTSVDYDTLSSSATPYHSADPLLASRLTAPVDGWYRINAAVFWAANSRTFSGAVQTAIYKNALPAMSDPTRGDGIASAVVLDKVNTSFQNLFFGKHTVRAVEFMFAGEYVETIGTVYNIGDGFAINGTFWDGCFVDVNHRSNYGAVVLGSDRLNFVGGLGIPGRSDYTATGQRGFGPHSSMSMELIGR